MSWPRADARTCCNTAARAASMIDIDPPMNSHIFREYDIRGNADRDLSDAVVRDIGRALGSLCAERGKRRIVVGRDCRDSSPRLLEALVAGLVETGRHVVRIEVGPTPLLYFAV